MKRLFATVLLCGIVNWGFSQFIVYPNPSLASGPLGSSFKCDGIFKNTSLTDTTYTWVRIQNLPAGWSSYVCDPITCWADTRDSSTFDLNPGDSNVLYTGFNTSQTHATVTVKLFVYPKGKRNMGDTVYYTASTWATSNKKTPVADQLQVYPNPVKSELTIRYESTSSLEGEIFDLAGKRIKTFMLNNGSGVIPVNTLPDGLYLLKIHDGNKQVHSLFLKN